MRRPCGPARRALVMPPRVPPPRVPWSKTRPTRSAAAGTPWPREGWQDRWTASGADSGVSWIDTLAPGDTRLAVTRRQEHVAGLACLLMCRVVLPGYDFLAACRPTGLLDRVRTIMRPEVFAGLEEAAATRGLSGRDRSDALRVISKIVLHTGKDVDALTADDVLEIPAGSVVCRPRQGPGLHAA